MHDSRHKIQFKRFTCETVQYTEDQSARQTISKGLGKLKGRVTQAKVQKLARLTTKGLYSKY